VKALVLRVRNTIAIIVAITKAQKARIIIAITRVQKARIITAPAFLSFQLLLAKAPSLSPKRHAMGLVFLAKIARTSILAPIVIHAFPQEKETFASGLLLASALPRPTTAT